MKFAGGFKVLISACVPLAIACSSAVTPDFFSERGGARNSSGAGTESANAGLSDGGALELAGAGGTLGGVAGRPSTGDAGKSGVNSSGHGGMNAGDAGGSASAGRAGTTAGAAGASAGAAGASAGAGAGGTAEMSAGSGGIAASGAGTGGSVSGSGGDTGSSGSGGASVCPVNPPQRGAICDVDTPNSCFYAGRACSCLPATGPGPTTSPKKWACFGDGASCPDTKPIAGTSCKPNASLDCPYPGNDYCVCPSNGFDPRWVCQTSPPVCAANKPGDQSCNLVRTCSWGVNNEVACFCNGNSWSCEGGF